tara:strand:+ start:640 stop:876 length:237 start_codon:yes stop_codon:yes gene_type:complete
MFKNILKIINFKVFLISLLFGLIYIHIMDDRKKILVHPTLINKDEILYKNKSGDCFKVDLNEVSCPNNKKNIINIINK